MVSSGAVIAAVILMQAVNPILGMFAPSRETPAGAVTIEPERIAFSGGVVLETTTESGGAFRCELGSSPRE